MIPSMMLSGAILWRLTWGEQWWEFGYIFQRGPYFTILRRSW